MDRHDTPSPKPKKSVIDLSRYEDLIDRNATVLDTLREAYANDPDKFKEVLKEASYAAVLQDEEFTNNIARLKTGLPEKDDVALRGRQKEIMSDYRQRIVREAGIPTEAALSQIELGKKMIAERVASFGDEIDTSEELLEKLGILEYADGDSIPKFTYPEGLFPDSVDEKWLAYLGSVQKHISAVRELEAGTGNQHDVVDADRSRTIAHNAVTGDVHQILELDALSDGEWGFQKTRNLIAKMRDHRYPTVETAEADITALTLSRTIGGGVLSVLSAKLSEIRRQERERQ